MKELARFASFLILLLISVPLLCEGEWSLKVSGGLSYFKFDMANRILNDWRLYQKKDSDYERNWTFTGKEGVSFHSGLDLDGEALYFFSPYFAAGLGTGQIYGRLAGEKNELKQAYDDGFGNVLVTFSYVRPNTASATPLFLSGYFFLRPGSKISLFIRGSAGLLWASYADRVGYRDLTEEDFFYIFSQRASASGWTAAGGLGFAWEFTPGLSFFIEGLVRQAKVQGFQGKNRRGEEGILYYFEEYLPYLDFWQSQHLILAEPPSGENFRSIREAELDFSGFSAQIGLMMRF